MTDVQVPDKAMILPPKLTPEQEEHLSTKKSNELAPKVDVSKPALPKLRSSISLITPIEVACLLEEKKSGLDLIDELAENQKAKLPIPKLSAFAVTASILAYVGYADEVIALIK